MNKSTLNWPEGKAVASLLNFLHFSFSSHQSVVEILCLSVINDADLRDRTQNGFLRCVLLKCTNFLLNGVWVRRVFFVLKLLQLLIYAQ